MTRGSREPEPGTVWTAGQVARHLRIAESTLRTWHRRYGVGPHNPQPGRYRRYTPEDVGRLRHMRDLITSGMLPSDAAKTVEAMAYDSGSPGEDLTQVVAAARVLDSGRCLRVIEQAIARQGVVETWDRLCRPALITIDGDQREDPDCVDTEHVLSWAVSAALHRVPRPADRADRRPVLLACTEQEQHSLPLEALSAALAERDLPVRMLGAATPPLSLNHAVTAARPLAVVLWSHRADTASPAAVRVLRNHQVRRLIAGPGWPARRPVGTEYLSSLKEALLMLTGHL
ncbi:DNA-binding transcriptional MerR regulator [Amycolatopsis bartoniae]|uniref:MerR family transcriptional regulator n=1 Tax=Amycolatopsis bartoniae TaxID=941986 RepID=A0A8H9IPC7_9PSEU|nr:MerR family transcriptional regulator [Amycolatopsis bartoniae]MBB2938339.1 DNA-binding transcriptional MerR regulator [Amycolatopsis bartoniae]TVT01801.1 MerR family transcriptional regulator [Amycolatopsis bartoniae]GHF34454.1 MerR family transcriptional regulator [Amycolatopsis bartoniae]